MKSTTTNTLRVELHGSTVHIGNLDVRLDAAAEYMRGIPSDKWEAAFVHAVQVGMTEIIARRRRFQSDAHAAVPMRKPTPVVMQQPAVVEVARVEKIELPPEPRMDALRDVSLDKPASATRPAPESESWLQRLDEQFETLDSAQPLDSSSRGR